MMELSVEMLKCKSCGAALEVPNGARSVRCEQCGQQMAVDGVSAMPRHANGEPFRDLLLRLYCRVMIGLILYVLSTGPMYWAIYAAYNASGSSFLAKLYFPIVWACQQSEWVSRWFNWYVGLWVY